MLVLILDNTVVSKKAIKVLGLFFDRKLQWADNIMDVIYRANHALNAIKLIRKLFNTKELITLVTSNFYSVLFYNSEVWHIPSLNQDLKHSLFVASAMALKMCLHYPDNTISHHDLHKMTKRATPEMFREYKTAFLLFKAFND